MGSAAARRTVLDGGRLDLALLAELAARPAPFTPGDPYGPADWTEPDVAAGILRRHLEWREGEDLRPSFEPATTDQIARWIIARLGLQPGQRVLDLGCGVGRDALSLAGHGLDVTAIDYVPVLIDHARGAARERGLAVDYRCEDFWAMDFAAEYDAVMQLGGAFQTYVPSRLDDFLRRVRRALKPGGRYLAELLTNVRRCGIPARMWDCAAGEGGEELVLSQTEDYPDHDVSLLQCVVVRADGTVLVQRTWQTDHTPATATALLERYGFAVEGVWGGVTGRTYVDTGDALLVVARAV